MTHNKANPSVDKAMLQSGGPLPKDSTLAVCDPGGRHRQLPPPAGGSPIEGLSTADFALGTYIVHHTTSQYTITGKLVVVR